GLHGAAGSRTVVELHGALARVRCLACEVIISRAKYQDELLAANPSHRSPTAALAPDGDAELADVAGFAVVPCAACGGVVMCSSAVACRARRSTRHGRCSIAPSCCSS